MDCVIELGTQKGQSGASPVFGLRHIEFVTVVEYSGGDFEEKCLKVWPVGIHIWRSGKRSG